MDFDQVRAVCEAAMREYGMPLRIRTDNGAPFAGAGLLGLSKLSLGWMKLGTLAEREEISRGIASGSSIREIARGLQRAASTVSREVARHGGHPQTCTQGTRPPPRG